MLAKFCIIAGLVFSPWVAASFCESETPKSVVFEEQEFDLCKEVVKPFVYLGDKVTLLTSMLDQEKSPQQEVTESYWEQWLLNQQSAPVFTSQLDNKSVIGFGLWMPEELEELETDMSMSEWIASQGLHVGLGFGEKGKEPRVRFDYRWHEDTHLDMMMQVEVPF